MSQMQDFLVLCLRFVHSSVHRFVHFLFFDSISDYSLIFCIRFPFISVPFHGSSCPFPGAQLRGAQWPADGGVLPPVRTRNRKRKEREMKWQDSMIPGFSLPLSQSHCPCQGLGSHLHVFSCERFLLHMQVRIREKGQVQVHVFADPQSTLVQSLSGFQIISLFCAW
jgi:hypothetical protein